MESDIEYPTVTVDRAVGHYWEGIDVDPDALVDFYNSLPKQDKPPISECHIHFSARSEEELGDATVGYCCREPTQIAPDGDLPPVDVLVLLGSSYSWRREYLEEVDFDSYSIDPDEPEDISRTVGHELVHFTQSMESKKKSAKEDSKRKRKSQARKDLKKRAKEHPAKAVLRSSREATLGALALDFFQYYKGTGLEFTTDENLATTATFILVGSVAFGAVKQGIANLRWRYFRPEMVAYDKSPVEEEAEKLSRDFSGAVSVGPMRKPPEGFEPPEDDLHNPIISSKQRRFRRKLKEQCLTPVDREAQRLNS